MQRILYEISSTNYYTVKFQDIWHVPCIKEKWKYGFCYQKFGYLPNNPAYADKNEKFHNLTSSHWGLVYLHLAIQRC